ncbi:dTDP-4-dehydrorhamnose 3,5-epimerase [Tenacibaculum sp. SG-28]|uniref:dTDP-4-dehydrorhamnose 3,5-epimerase n=1 Tax=Tenacibaculum sp. SG-28 TaxID=754426 RepID=UPI000CF3AF09|nr:dTDP-4-dehydrorhamnose 3,5-epimerase [Tenacibaculum sp. SG-28]PQJ21872.1 dTDP-4-dehydrorhamnose 3,5-epimerase [Tenacibaculum sp. SG-28]
MKIIQTPLEGCFIIEPKLFEDGRGYFFESFNQQLFENSTGIKVTFIQDNEAFSNRGIIRGLHYQKGKFAQAKLVRVVRGKVRDVVVDLRVNSKTFGQHFAIELSGENKKQLFIPRGFAHGYAVLEDHTYFAYKCDNHYHKASEAGVVYNDSSLKIDWKIPDDEVVLSDKDKILPNFKKLL